jgi:hypothetical protein
MVDIMNDPDIYTGMTIEILLQRLPHSGVLLAKGLAKSVFREGTQYHKTRPW